MSELSKPVAWTSARSLDVRRKITAFTDVESAAEYASANCWEKIVPLYSQEYVSALIQRAERLDSMLTESVQALKAAEQRNAELEAKLATPVRLSRRYETAGYCIAEHYCQEAADGDYLDRDELIASLREQGFTVEGDE